MPVGIEIGSGVKTAATPRVMSQGTSTPTEKELDIAIRGEGFFVVNLPDGRTGYTRDGSFERDATGQLVNVDGYQRPARHHHSGQRQLGFDQRRRHGRGLPRQPTPRRPSWASSSSRASSTRPACESIGNNLFVETAASGPAQIGTPNTDGMGNLLQGYLESSNVNSVTEIADLIAAQRAYEMNARVISGADEMLQATSQMR